MSFSDFSNKKYREFPGIFYFSISKTILEVNTMKKRLPRKKDSASFRLDPSIRLCPNFDHSSMALYLSDRKEDMGVVVLDDCAEEHIQ